MRRRRLPIAAVLAASVVATTLMIAPAGAAADEPIYHLPAADGVELIVSQGNDERRGRGPDEQYAFDFVAADETPRRFSVAAARGGTVLAQRSGVRGGRCDEPQNGPRPACWSQVNYVLIDHGDGTSGLYLHLRRGDPLVRRDDVVAAGQPIGTAGNSGWTDEVGVQFQLQPTPPWNEWGSPGWFQTESLPVAFSDSSVTTQRADGVPLTADELISENTPPARPPFRFARRTVDLPALVPLEPGEERFVSRAYDADSPDGYGLHFAPPLTAPLTAPTEPDVDAAEAPTDSEDPVPLPVTDPGTAVRPLFGGWLVFAGCATGTSASLGRTVAIVQNLEDGDYLAILGHLSDVEPALLDADPDAGVLIGPNETLGHYGAILAPDETPALACPDADPGAVDLFAGILRDATVSSEGEITDGTPISPEPLLGRGAYENLVGWSGPVRAVPVDEEAGRPRVNWTKKTPARGAHIPYGGTVPMVARVRDATDIGEVRFRVYYDRWARMRSSHDFTSFDPKRTWRQVAVCRPPGASGEPPRVRGCDWNGDARDAVVSFVWDPLAAEEGQAAPWLPRVRTALGPRVEDCVAASLAVEVVDAAGHVRSSIGSLPTPAECDLPAVDQADSGRVVYLDPLRPPRAPVNRGRTDEDRPFPYDEALYGPDPLDGHVAWRDRSNNEDGFYIYIRRNWLQPDCSISTGNFVRVATLPANTRRYRPRHQQNLKAAPAPEILDVPGSMTRYQMYVSAFNEVGESSRVLLGAFLAGGEGFCSLGLEPPPEL